jgi:uncharacterized membrane protein
MKTDLRSIPNIRALLTQHFFSGLLVVIPLGVVAWMLVAMLGALWGLQELLPDAWKPQSLFQDPAVASLFNFLFTLGMGFLAALGISFLGWVSKQYLGLKILELIGFVIQRIPVVRTVYSALDQLLKTVAAGGGKQFNRVVYVEFPRAGCWTLAFVTGSARLPGQSTPHLNVFVPATPNPTSGFYLIVAEKDVREANMSVEEAFKAILSLGIASGSSS